MKFLQIVFRVRLKRFFVSFSWTCLSLGPTLSCTSACSTAGILIRLSSPDTSSCLLFLSSTSDAALPTSFLRWLDVTHTLNLNVLASVVLSVFQLLRRPARELELFWRRGLPAKQALHQVFFFVSSWNVWFLRALSAVITCNHVQLDNLSRSCVSHPDGR